MTTLEAAEAINEQSHDGRAWYALGYIASMARAGVAIRDIEGTHAVLEAIVQICETVTPWA